METNYRKQVETVRVVKGAAVGHTTARLAIMWPEVLDEAVNRCPSCGGRDLHVTGTVKKAPGVIHRYRVCACGARATFQEVVE